MIRRYSVDASQIRERGHRASVGTIQNVRSDEWVSCALQAPSAGMTLGDYALLAEYAPQQWQRDMAVTYLLNSPMHPRPI